MPRDEPHYTVHLNPSAPDRAYQQGQLDGLCCLYSAVNAVRLVCAPRHHLDTVQCRRLFQAGIDLLAKRGKLLQALKHGMEPALGRAVLKRVVTQLYEDTAIKVWVRRPLRSTPRVRHALVAETIEAAIARGAVVVLVLEGAHEHCTLIDGHSASAWRLHDSSGLQRLAKAVCGSSRSRKRHRIDPTSIETLELARSGRHRSADHDSRCALYGQTP